MLIDCDSCVARHTACADCVITMVLNAPASRSFSDAVIERTPTGREFDSTELRALSILAGVGLIPEYQGAEKSSARRLRAS